MLKVIRDRRRVMQRDPLIGQLGRIASHRKWKLDVTSRQGEAQLYLTADTERIERRPRRGRCQRGKRGRRSRWQRCSETQNSYRRGGENEYRPGAGHAA